MAVSTQLEGGELGPTDDVEKQQVHPAASTQDPGPAASEGKVELT